jgi:hypothetical protein
MDHLFVSSEVNLAGAAFGALTFSYRSMGGMFTPAPKSPNNNFDLWVIATATNETDPNGKALVGKGYLVVTVPFYTFRGRRYVRDLDRWIDDGPAEVGLR